MGRRIIVACAASSYLHALLLPRAVDWCRATWTKIQVETDERAGEMIMNVWPGASRARKRSPNPKDGRARLEAVAAWPEEPRLQRREHYDESQAVESRYYVLVGKAEELANQGVGAHRAASEKSGSRPTGSGPPFMQSKCIIRTCSTHVCRTTW